MVSAPDDQSMIERTAAQINDQCRGYPTPGILVEDLAGPWPLAAHVVWFFCPEAGRAPG